MIKKLPITLLIFIIVVVVALLGLQQRTEVKQSIVAQAANGTAGPVLFFSDLTDGPTSGWEGSATKGAAVSIWGNNFGTTRGTSYITVCGQQLTSASDYAEWAVVNTLSPGQDPNDDLAYQSARGLERITFWLNSNMQTGPGTITVTTADGASQSIPFYCRNTGLAG